MMYRILFLLILLCSSVQSSDYLDSLRNMQVAIRSALHFDTLATGGLTDEETQRWIQEAVVTTMPLMRGIKGVDSFVTAGNQIAYSLDSTILGITSVRWSKNDTLKLLQYVPMEQWFEVLKVVKTSDEIGKTLGKLKPADKRPSFYDYIDNEIYLYPVPTFPTGDTIKIVSWKKMTNILSDSSFTTIPTEYRVVILKYALWRAASSLEVPLAQLYYQDYIKFVSDINTSLNRKGPPVAPTTD